VAQDVGIAIIRANAKIHLVRPVPLIFYGLDKQNVFAKLKLDRTFIRFMAGIAFDLDFHTFVERSNSGSLRASMPAGRSCRLFIRPRQGDRSL